MYLLQLCCKINGMYSILTSLVLKKNSQLWSETWCNCKLSLWEISKNRVKGSLKFLLAYASIRFEKKTAHSLGCSFHRWHTLKSKKQMKYCKRLIITSVCSGPFNVVCGYRQHINPVQPKTEVGTAREHLDGTFNLPKWIYWAIETW